MSRFTNTPLARLGWVVALLLLTAWPGTGYAQSWEWVTTQQPASPGHFVVTATAADKAGGVVVAGYFFGSITLGATTLISRGADDIFVARLNSAGTWTQAVQAGGSSNVDQPTCLVIDEAGNVLVGGTFFSSTATFGAFTLTNADRNGGFGDLFIASLSPAGEWTRVIQAGQGGSEYVKALALDANNEVVVAGLYLNSFTLNGTTLTSGNGFNGSFNSFVARLTSAGTWKDVLQAGIGSSVVLQTMVLDRQGNPTIAGIFDGASAQFGSLRLTNQNFNGIIGGDTHDAFVARLDKTTNSWVQALQISSSKSCQINGLALAGNGDVMAVGSFTGARLVAGATTLVNADASGTTSDVFVAGLSPVGSFSRAVQVGGVNNDQGEAVAVDREGNTWITGSFASPTIRVAPFELANTSAGGTFSDVFLASLNPAGTAWTKAIAAGGPGSDAGISLALDASGAPIIGGTMKSPANFGALTLTTTVAATGFVAKPRGFVSPVPDDALPASNECFTLFPNPANLMVTFTPPAGSARQAVISDATGREVRRQPLPDGGGEARLNIAGLANGFYLVRCGTCSGRLVVK